MSDVSAEVLVLNCGSSSVKFALIDPATARRRSSGVAERVGTDDATMTMTVDGSPIDCTIDDSSYGGIVRVVLDRLSRAGVAPPVAVGHRVVHGGDRFTTSVVLDERTIDAIDAYSTLAPLHNPANLAGIRSARLALPHLPHVAVFDTAFHHTIPEKAHRYAVPQSWFEDLKIRRYGFHGTSHRYVSTQATDLLDLEPSDTRLVVAHLGNGCSVAAVRGGVSVDTSMGFTPLEGLIMGSRSGDIDPGIHGYVASRTGMTIDQITRALNAESGLLALSGAGNDMRSIVQAMHRGSASAHLAVDMFCYRVAKYVASFVVPLGGLDAIVFTGGIGEHSPIIRGGVLRELAPLGIEIDDDANRIDGRDTNGRITKGGSPAALVVPTDEELLIARDTIDASERRDA